MANKNRIMELSSELGVTNKKLLEILRKLDISVNSHVSSITDEEAAQVRKQFQKDASTPISALKSLKHESWVSPQIMMQNWLPEYFAPRFLHVDNTLENSRQKYLRIGDVLNFYGTIVSPKELPKWIVRRRGDSLTIERSVMSDKTHEGWHPLPDECLVVDPNIYGGTLNTIYWSSRIFGDKAYAPAGLYVFYKTGISDAAWIQIALSDPFVFTQIERMLLGKNLSRFLPIDFLELRIRIPSLEEEKYNSQMVQNELKKFRNYFTHRINEKNEYINTGKKICRETPVLTAATFEQRMEQFERLLVEDHLADDERVFLVQAARDNRESDLFIIRAVGKIRQQYLHNTSSTLLNFLENEESDRIWRQWYWDADSGVDYCIFNSLTGGPELPNHLIVRSIADPKILKSPSNKITIPSFSDFRTAIETKKDDSEELDLSNVFLNEDLTLRSSEIARLWARFNPSVPPTTGIIVWLFNIFRPVLAVRVLRGNQVSCVYLFFGDESLDYSGTLAHLEILGERFVAILHQPSQLTEEVARSESIRRLSSMMHPLSGILTRIGSVVEEMAEFVRNNPEIAAKLLPSEKKAHDRAAMNNLPIEEYSLGARLIKLEAAVEEIRRLRYLIIRCKNAQGELQVSTFDLHALLEELAADAQGQLADLRVQIICDQGLFVEADRELIRTALIEVVNNACRECRDRGVTRPSMIFAAYRRKSRAQITIEDNGFPTNEILLSDPFAEDASTYRAQGRGCGLGLFSVKESFLRHHSQCKLEENKAEDGSRRPGVTFWADLQVSQRVEMNKGEDKHV